MSESTPPWPGKWTWGATAVLLLGLAASGSLVALLVGALVCVALGGWSSRQMQNQHHWFARQSRSLQDKIDAMVVQQKRRGVESTRVMRALDQIRDGVAILDDRQKLLWMNPAASGMLRIADVPRAIGRRVTEVVRYPVLTESLAGLTPAQGKTAFKLEVPAGTAVIPLSGEVEAFEVDDQLHWLLSLHDETDSFRMESIRRDIIANLSHELKTPLAAIKGYAETVELAIEDDPDAAEHFLTQIRHQCERLEKLVSSVLQMARAQSGGNKLRPEWLELRELVESCGADTVVLAERKEIELEYIAGQPVKIFSDREALTTILNNLLSNAIQYTPSGGDVRVGYEKLEAAGENQERVRLFVEDTGMGISEEHQKLVFDRFYRVQSARQTGYSRKPMIPKDDPAAPVETDRRGTGIGLSIVKTLTESLGGTVRLRSKLGQGSRFEVELPVQMHPANAIAPVSSFSV